MAFIVVEAIWYADDVFIWGAEALPMGARSLYIFLQMPVREEREPRFVSNASRTLITSRGYVKNTDTRPAREPLVSLRRDVS